MFCVCVYIIFLDWFTHFLSFFQLQVFFRERLGPVLSNQASVRMKHVVSKILTAALLTTQESTTSPRSVCLALSFIYCFYLYCKLMSGGIQTHLHVFLIRQLIKVMWVANNHLMRYMCVRCVRKCVVLVCQDKYTQKYIA